MSCRIASRRSHGAGADVMKRIAAPMVGGVITSFVLELLTYPVIFTVWKGRHGLEPATARVASAPEGGMTPSPLASSPREAP